MEDKLTNILLGEILDRAIRSDFGGSRPDLDPVIRLKAKIQDRVIWVFCVGKWRPIRHYSSTKRIPSPKIVMEVTHSVKVNAGWTNNPKPIVLEWLEAEND